MTGSHACAVNVQFCPPPAELARYFTTFYRAEITVDDGGAEGGRVSDLVHPEWGNLRFPCGAGPDAENLDGTRVSGSKFLATGPSSRALGFTIGTCRMWGIGLLPLGWAKFVGAPAAELANRAVDGDADPAFASFRALGDSLFGPKPDPAAELARITAHFRARLREPVADETRIASIHAALVDPAVATVAALVERAGASARTVERVCGRAFGFSPKLLLRRQRFMRSLADYMVDPSLKWIGALDSHYHDQAQFVRDFREFIGMTPRDYASIDHPVIGAFVHARARDFGSAVQALDGPGGCGVRR